MTVIVMMFVCASMATWLYIYWSKTRNLKYTEEDVTNARKDALKQSHSTVSGKVNEHLAPLLPEFGEYNLRDARFLGSPLDFVIFDGLDANEEVKIVFLEVKSGNSGLTSRERKIRDAVQAGRVEWSLVRLKKKVDDPVEAVVE